MSIRQQRRRIPSRQVEKTEQHRTRVTVALEQDKPIGLELDFSLEVTTGPDGVRVSRVDAGGAAESRGVGQEDRLVLVSGVDVRGVEHERIRDLLLNRDRTIQLVFERTPGRPPPATPTPLPLADAGTTTGDAKGTRTKNGNGTSNLGDGASDVSPVDPAAAAAAAPAPAPAAAARERGSRAVIGTASAGQHRRHQLYSSSNSASGNAAAAAAAAPASTAEAAKVLTALAGSKLPPSTAEAEVAEANVSQNAFRKRRRRRETTQAAVTTTTTTTTEKGPLPSPPVQSMLEQLDLLAAEQERTQEMQEEKNPAPPPRRLSPPAAAAKKPERRRRPPVTTGLVRKQLQEEEEHEEEVEEQRRHREGRDGREKERRRRRRRQQRQRPRSAAARKAEGGERERQAPARGEENPRRDDGNVSDRGGAGADASAAEALSPPLPPSPSRGLGKRRQARPRARRRRRPEELLAEASASAASTAASCAWRQQREGNDRPGGNGEGTHSGIKVSPPAPPPPPLPAWLGALVGLEMAEFTGTEAARAAVLMRKARDMEAKELAVLRRLHKVKADVSLDKYTDLRGDSLRSSAAYADLETLQEQYRHRQPEAHEQELADLAINGSFLSNLLGGDGSAQRSPTASVASPSATWSPSLSPSLPPMDSRKSGVLAIPLVGAAAVTGTSTVSSPTSRPSALTGKLEHINGGDDRCTGDGGGHGHCGGGGERSQRTQPRQTKQQPQQQPQQEGEHKHQEEEQQPTEQGGQNQQQHQPKWSPKRLTEEDVRVARAQLERKAERVRVVKETQGVMQEIIRRSLALRERAIAITDTHQAIRRQSLQDVKETREAGEKTDKGAKQVLAKIRAWEKTARTSEALAFEVAGDVACRAQALRDAADRSASRMETQNAQMQLLAVFRVLNGPVASLAPDLVDR